MGDSSGSDAKAAGGNSSSSSSSSQPKAAKSSLKKPQKKITRDLIGDPQNFQHTGHIGVTDVRAGVDVRDESDGRGVEGKDARGDFLDPFAGVRRMIQGESS